jgi:hypothetical protein
VSSGVLADDAGKYFFTGLPPGKYRLMAGSESDFDLTTGGDDLEDDEDLLVTVELRAGDKITLDLKKIVIGR